nr:MAG TPA: hypothetical protein [Caudoviricetes sp.]
MSGFKSVALKIGLYTQFSFKWQQRQRFFYKV